MIFPLVYYYSQACFKVIRAQVHKLLDELLNISLPRVRSLLVNDKDEAVGIGRVMGPEVRVLAAEVPHLKLAALRVIVLKVVERITLEMLRARRQHLAKR